MGSEHHVLSYSTTVLLVYLVSGIFFVLLVKLSQANKIILYSQFQVFFLFIMGLAPIMPCCRSVNILEINKNNYLLSLVLLQSSNSSFNFHKLNTLMFSVEMLTHLKTFGELGGNLKVTPTKQMPSIKIYLQTFIILILFKNNKIERFIAA